MNELIMEFERVGAPDDFPAFSSRFRTQVALLQ